MDIHLLGIVCVHFQSIFVRFLKLNNKKCVFVRCLFLLTVFFFASLAMCVMVNHMAILFIFSLNLSK